MLVSKKKLKALVDENMALKKENRNLKVDNERLSDSNLDLWYENILLNVKLQRKENKVPGAYFYEAAKQINRIKCNSD